MTDHTAFLLFAAIAVTSYLLGRRRKVSLESDAVLFLAFYASTVLAGIALLRPTVTGAS